MAQAHNLQSPIIRQKKGFQPVDNKFIEPEDFVKIMEVVGLTENNDDGTVSYTVNDTGVGAEGYNISFSIY